MIGLSNNILSIHDLTFSFQHGRGKTAIFNKLSMHVNTGEFVSIIGASGSGKSTLFRLIAGLLEQNSGDIQLNGERIVNRLGTVGYMPQKDLLLPWKTVLENVLLPLEISKVPKQKKMSEIKEWLSRFGLTSYEHAYPHELSGGMRQRVAFLRTIIAGRELILLDEPFGALDALTKRNMHKWLLELWGELQKTVLFITHDLEEAILLSDRIYLLPSGESQKIQEVHVDLPRPRRSEIVYQQEFIELRKNLECLIHDKT
ncbi:ABC transporter ATP-binding protein [Heyndrickxia ginsengihumi]|uniref:ABC transporter ATP-binding protein n=1 Tax=Heyndrickxia ginsengihumi TaxID=363870 RepID=UPI0006854C35|nr:ABC transporter ATP-binding protein [Heyndrickxia ginsengihumi]